MVWIEVARLPIVILRSRGVPAGSTTVYSKSVLITDVAAVRSLSCVSATALHSVVSGRERCRNEQLVASAERLRRGEVPCSVELAARPALRAAARQKCAVDSRGRVDRERGLRRGIADRLTGCGAIGCPRRTCALAVVLVLGPGRMAAHRVRSRRRARSLEADVPAGDLCLAGEG